MRDQFSLSELGYSTPYESAIKKTLEAFKGWLSVGRFIVGGGIAGRIALADHNIVPPAGEFDNIDLIVESLHAIPSGILMVEGFWLSFKNFEFINIWDREHDSRIHVFTTHIPPKEYIVWRYIENVGWIQIVGKDWLFARMLIDLQRVLDLNTFPVDPKQFDMVKALREIIDEAEVDEIWRSYFAEHAGFETWRLLWEQVMPYENSFRVVSDPFNTGNGKKQFLKLLSMLKWTPYVAYKRIFEGYL